MTLLPLFSRKTSSTLGSFVCFVPRGWSNFWDKDTPLGFSCGLSFNLLRCAHGFQRKTFSFFLFPIPFCHDRAFASFSPFQALPYVCLLIAMLFFIYAIIGMQVRNSKFHFQADTFSWKTCFQEGFERHTFTIFHCILSFHIRFPKKRYSETWLSIPIPSITAITTFKLLWRVSWFCFGEFHLPEEKELSWSFGMPVFFICPT